MVSNIQKSTAAASIGYLGQSVKVDGSTATLANGAAKWTYNLPQEAAVVNLAIKDASGNTVRTLQGATGKGDQTVTWDGRDINNNKLGDGQYTLSIEAKDGSGALVSTTTTSTGKVDSISFDSSGSPQLMIGGRAYQTSSILAVQTAATAN
jgi:flagellar basal-body rod modification protein FlgD